MPRTDVTFPSGGGSCAAWLYVPNSAPASGPILVMAHGLGGVRQMRLDAFAERFSSAGYRCLLFDYRRFGASPGEPRQLLSVRRQLEDWRNVPETPLIMAWIDMPSLQVIASDQYYSSIDSLKVRYASGTRGVDVELEVDEDGVVVHYPDMARRV